jgi:hypothetical protein
MKRSDYLKKSAIAAAGRCGMFSAIAIAGAAWVAGAWLSAGLWVSLPLAVALAASVAAHKHGVDCLALTCRAIAARRAEGARLTFSHHP